MPTSEPHATYYFFCVQFLLFCAQRLAPPRNVTILGPKAFGKRLLRSKPVLQTLEEGQLGLKWARFRHGAARTAGLLGDLVDAFRNLLGPAGGLQWRRQRQSELFAKLARDASRCEAVHVGLLAQWLVEALEVIVPAVLPTTLLDLRCKIFII